MITLRTAFFFFWMLHWTGSIIFLQWLCMGNIQWIIAVYVQNDKWLLPSEFLRIPLLFFWIELFNLIVNDGSKHLQTSNVQNVLFFLLLLIQNFIRGKRLSTVLTWWFKKFRMLTKVGNLGLYVLQLSSLQLPQEHFCLFVHFNWNQVWSVMKNYSFWDLRSKLIKMRERERRMLASVVIHTIRWRGTFGIYTLKTIL